MLNAILFSLNQIKIISLIHEYNNNFHSILAFKKSIILIGKAHCISKPDFDYHAEINTNLLKI